MPYSPKAQLDPDLKIFRDLVQSGITPTASYKRVYAATRNISDQAAYAGGVRKMAILNRLNPPTASLNSTTQPVKSQPVDDKKVTGTKDGLIKRLWKTVIDGKDEASTNAATKLFAWYEQADQQSQDAARLDPVAICRHLRRYNTAPADDSELQGILRALCDTIRVTPEQIVRALTTAPGPDRADAPPIQQVPDFIDPNEPSKIDNPAISDPIQEKQCPLDANEGQRVT